MLKELHLTNIILVESSTIHFVSGLNVLSGESGSGKSAIMNALNLIAGERSDTGYIRRGADKGAVEAVFDIERIPQLSLLLDEAGINHEPGSELFIRRELTAAGKSRAFINNQLAQLTLLRQVTEHLFNIVGQHANQKLLSLDYHRQALDLFGDLQTYIEAFASSWEEETKTKTKLEQLIASEAKRMRDTEICRMEIEELFEANIKDGEDEEVFAEYTTLSNAEELAQKVGEITNALNGERGAVLPILVRQKGTFEQLIRLAPSLQETAKCYDNALLEMQEVAYSLRNFEHRIENNPEKAERLNKRLELITKLKRKYGPSINEVNQYLKQAQEKLTLLENTDNQIDELKERVKSLANQSNHLSQQLTEARKTTSLKFQKAIEFHLRALNMPKVEFSFDIIPQKRSKLGDDRVEFFMTPNVGEHRISLRECASGGELSRTMLAMQAVLAGREKIPTLVFDEVDANIGGATATVIGEKLREIGVQHQVLCITHFPQVAKYAQHHLRISKREVEGRTVTIVDHLDETTRQQEFTRMIGG